MVDFRIVAALIGLLVASPASAAVVSKTYTFSATNFIGFAHDLLVPIDNLVGSFRLTFDDTAFVTDTTAGLSSPTISIPVNSAIGYYYSGDGLFVLGGLESGVNTIEGETNDFFMVISSFNTTPMFESIVYENLSQPNFFYISTDGDISAVAVPEPLTWALLIGGFTLVGGALRARRRVSKPSNGQFRLKV